MPRSIRQRQRRHLASVDQHHQHGRNCTIHQRQYRAEQLRHPTAETVYATLRVPIRWELLCPTCDTPEAVTVLFMCVLRVEINPPGDIDIFEVEDFESLELLDYDDEAEFELETEDNEIESEEEEDEEEEEEEVEDADEQDPFGLMQEALACGFQLSPDELARHNAFWQTIEEETNFDISAEDRCMFFATPAIQSEARKFLLQCVQDNISGCWRRYNVYKNAYERIMKCKTAWAHKMPPGTQEQKLRVYAHPNLPALYDAAHGEAIVRHHPFRCELFHQGDDHGRCCRPSHLAWGSKARNKLDEEARKAVMLHFFLKGFKGDIDTPHDHEHLDHVANEIALANQYVAPAGNHKFAPHRVAVRAVTLFLSSVLRVINLTPDIPTLLRSFMAEHVPV